MKWNNYSSAPVISLQNKHSQYPDPDWYLSQKALAGVFVSECEIVCYGAGQWQPVKSVFCFDHQHLPDWDGVTHFILATFAFLEAIGY